MKPNSAPILCLIVEGAVEIIVLSSILLRGIKVSCTFSVPPWEDLYLLLLCMDAEIFPSTQNVVLGKEMNDLIHPKVIC